MDHSASNRHLPYSWLTRTAINQANNLPSRPYGFQRQLLASACPRLDYAPFENHALEGGF